MRLSRRSWGGPSFQVHLTYSTRNVDSNIEIIE
jgi:hypothetical protein